MKIVSTNKNNNFRDFVNFFKTMVIGERLAVKPAQTLSDADLQGKFPGEDIDVVFVQCEDGAEKEEFFWYRSQYSLWSLALHVNAVGIRTKGLTQ